MSRRMSHKSALTTDNTILYTWWEDGSITIQYVYDYKSETDYKLGDMLPSPDNTEWNAKEFKPISTVVIASDETSTLVDLYEEE